MFMRNYGGGLAVSGRISLAGAHPVQRCTCDIWEHLAEPRIPPEHGGGIAAEAVAEYTGAGHDQCSPGTAP